MRQNRIKAPSTIMNNGSKSAILSNNSVSNQLVDQSTANTSKGVTRQWVNADEVFLGLGENTSTATNKPRMLKETANEALAAWEKVKLDKLAGEYAKVKGHHVHAKKAFEGHVNYDPKKGFSISNQLMENLEIKHEHITNAQRKLFKDLKDSGRPNTLQEHTRIAVESLIEAGIEKKLARKIVAESLQHLRLSDVKHPTHIPWSKMKD